MAMMQVTDIYLRSSLVAGERPSPGDIQAGEIMLNLADQLVFVGTGGGAYFTVGAGGGGGSGVTASPTAPATPTLGDIWVDVSNPAQPVINVQAAGGWMVVAQVDGVTIQHDPATGAIGVARIDMGLIP